MDQISWGIDVCEDDIFKEFFDGSLEDSGFPMNAKNECSSFSSLVLDNERETLAKAPAKVERKGVPVEREIAALKTHSEAERRRRARINSHLDTLRSLIPGAQKMDKASLLADVVRRLRELKRAAAEASRSFLIPTDIDGIRVEQQEDGLYRASYIFRVSLCCDWQPQLLSDLRQVLDTLHLRTMRTEIATLEGRIAIVFVMMACREVNVEDDEMCQLLATSVQKAFSSAMEKYSNSDVIPIRTALSTKRRRISLLGYSGSNSSDAYA